MRFNAQYLMSCALYGAISSAHRYLASVLIVARMWPGIHLSVCARRPFIIGGQRCARRSSRPKHFTGPLIARWSTHTIGFRPSKVHFKHNHPHPPANAALQSVRLIRNPFGHDTAANCELYKYFNFNVSVFVLCVSSVRGWCSGGQLEQSRL